MAGFSAAGGAKVSDKQRTVGCVDRLPNNPV